MTPAARTSAYSQYQGIAVLISLVVVTLAADFARVPLNVLGEPIRRSLHIDDLQLSLLFGVFTAAPALATGPVGGWLSDHMPRRALLAFGLVLWTLGSLICSLAHTYQEMIVGRLISSVGGGVQLPVAMTWISDAFPPAKRGRAVGSYFIVLGFGPALAAMSAGVVERVADHGAFAHWAALGNLEPWRVTMLVLALPSIVVLPLLLGMRDTRGSDCESTGSEVGNSIDSNESVRWGLLMALIGSMALMGMLDSANVSWMPTVFRRSFGYDAQKAGFAFGFVVLVAGFAGPLIGGWAGDAVFRRYGAKGRLWLCSAMAAACAPLLLAYVGRSGQVLVLALTLNGVATVTVLALGYVVIQTILPPKRRGFGTGITGAVMALVGSVSPTLVALLSTHMFRGPTSLATVLAISGPFWGLAAALALAVLARDAGRLSNTAGYGAARQG